MIKIEFPADRKDIALEFGNALLRIAKEADLVERYVPKSGMSPGTAENAEAHGKEEPTTPAEDSLVDAQETDVNEVKANYEFVAKAKEPFYGAGHKWAGQWKKRKGISEREYQAWYEGELAKSKHPDETQDEIDVASAFSPTGFSVFEAQQPEDPTPSDAAELMAWVSEKQAAGRLNQDHVNTALVEAQVSMADLFSANAKENVAKVYARLVVVCR